MEYIGDVFYDYGGGLYVNMTNRCPCHCDFCIRDMADSLGAFLGMLSGFSHYFTGTSPYL